MRTITEHGLRENLGKSNVALGDFKGVLEEGSFGFGIRSDTVVRRVEHSRFISVPYNRGIRTYLTDLENYDKSLAVSMLHYVW